MKNFNRLTFALICLLFCSMGIGLWAQEKPDALQLYNKGNYEEAIQVCEQELLQDSSNLDSYTVLCWSLVKNRQYSEAEQRATQGLEVNAYDHRLVEILAEAKFYLGKNTEALNLFERYISYVPTSGSRIGSAYYFMGEIYIRQGRYNHADISLTTAVRHEPLLDYWWTRLGYAREMAGSYRSAVDAYDKALSLNHVQQDAIRGRERASAHL